MKNNESGQPIFETDDARSYFLTILPIKKLEKKEDVYPVVTGRKPADTTDIGDRLRPIATDYAQLTNEESLIMMYIEEKGKITRREALSIVHAGETKTKEILNSLLGQGNETLDFTGEVATLD